MPTRDASSVSRFYDTGTSGSGPVTQSWTSSAFSPPADSWLYFTMHGAGNSGETPTHNTPSNTGTALTWTKVAERVNASGGSAVVWRAYNASAQSGITCTGTITWPGSNPGNTNSAGAFIDVWTGCATDQSTAATATSTSTSQTNNPSVTTTATGSRVAGTMVDWNQIASPTSSDTIDAYAAPGTWAVSGALVYKASDSGAAGSVSLNMVAGGASPVNTLIVYEILAATAPPPPSSRPQTQGRKDLTMHAEDGDGFPAALDMRNWFKTAQGLFVPDRRIWVPA